MARSLSNDLRWRVVHAYQAKEGTYRQLAVRFDIGTASVTRILALYRKNGTPAPRPHGGGNPPKVDAKGLELIARIVKDNPSATLLEIGQEYERVTSIKIGKSIVFRALEKMGITRKKKRFTPPSAIATESG